MSIMNAVPIFIAVHWYGQPRPEKTDRGTQHADCRLGFSGAGVADV